jgi:hypothetical protein
MASRVRITEATTGSPRGSSVYEYEAGDVLECSGSRMTERLAEILVADGAAEWVAPAGSPGDRETKPAGPEETKPAGPEETKERSFESNGGWKTFYESSTQGAQWQVGKAQCTKEEAEAWVKREVTLEELQN